MLYEFVTANRDAIITRSREKLTARPWSPASPQQLDHGVPLFLTQLAETLRAELSGVPLATSAIGQGASRHGAELLALGFTVSQVVHDYGDICQAVTEIAIEQAAPITVEEFKVLNGCLDTAIAEAVTEHARLTAEARMRDESDRVGSVAHETRDLTQTAILAYHALKRGDVPINGSTGAVLGRSLAVLRDIAEATLAVVRVGAQQHRLERVAVTPFLHELAAAGALHAESRQLKFALESGDPRWVLLADRQVLASAVMNLLNNAFKFTRHQGQVVLRASTTDEERLLIDVEDECGGIPPTAGDPFQSFAERRGHDRTGTGLGLSMARRAVEAHGGALYVRDVPGAGCVFTIDVPLARSASLHGTEEGAFRLPPPTGASSVHRRVPAVSSRSLEPN